MTSIQTRPTNCPAVSTATVADRCRARHRGGPVEVTGITNRSGEVRPGDLYVGVPGSRVHGAQFVAEAIDRGAVAVLTDLAGVALLGDVAVPVLESDDVRLAIGTAASTIYGDPSSRLTMLGITATSGKTTTAYLIRAILDAAGLTSGLIGTVETLVGDQRLPHVAGASFTTPEAPDLHALLAVMAEQGISHVVMEVSSHALQLGRVGGITFAVAGFANLSQDHLDFHHSMDDYFAAKALLFDGRARRHVLNIDDEWVRKLHTGPDDANVITISPRGGEAHWRVAMPPVSSLGGSTFEVADPRGAPHRVDLRLPGDFNAANALMALAMTDAIGIAPEVAALAMSRVQVPGRMERVVAGQPFLAIVDYSHKPAAVEAVLAAVRAQTTGRVLLVLGCGGDRDAGKRPIMGNVGARGADVLVVTDDNPRSEDPAAIRAAMLDGAREVPAAQRGEIVELGERAEAIAYAVNAAQAGDVVIVAGKGHEVGQYVAGVVHEFDDRVELRRAIEVRKS